jgi:hypothetical protein
MPIRTRQLLGRSSGRIAIRIGIGGCEFSERRKNLARSFDRASQANYVTLLTRASFDQNAAARTIASVVKKVRSTAPMLMYQHSRSGVSIPGK